MTNPLKEFNVWVTPKNFEELQNMIERQFTGPERAAAYTAMMYTQNMCAMMIDGLIADLEAKNV